MHLSNIKFSWTSRLPGTVQDGLLPCKKLRGHADAGRRHRWRSTMFAASDFIASKIAATIKTNVWTALFLSILLSLTFPHLLDYINFPQIHQHVLFSQRPSCFRARSPGDVDLVIECRYLISHLRPARSSCMIFSRMCILCDPMSGL